MSKNIEQMLYISKFWEKIGKKWEKFVKKYCEIG